MSSDVREILQRIVRLPEAQRAELDDELTRLDEKEWLVLRAEARRTARQRGITDDAIARAVESLRYGGHDPIK